MDMGIKSMFIEHIVKRWTWTVQKDMQALYHLLDPYGVECVLKSNIFEIGLE